MRSGIKVFPQVHVHIKQSYSLELALMIPLFLIFWELRSIARKLKNGLRVFAIPARLFITMNGEKVDKMNIQDSGQVASLALVGEDAAGNPAPLDPASAPVWTLDDSSLGSLAADPSNPLGQIFTPSGKLGTVNLSVSIPAVNAQPAMAGSGSLAVVAGSAVQVAMQISVAAPAAPAAPAS